MRRVAIKPRDNLAARASELGFDFLEFDGEPYWDESAYYAFTLAEIEDGLVPALQDRGLMRTAYEHKHFRDNLLAY